MSLSKLIRKILLEREISAKYKKKCLYLLNERIDVKDINLFVRSEKQEITNKFNIHTNRNFSRK